MTFLYNSETNVQGTHVIAIGVGAYRHLLNGKGKLFDRNEGMGQLSSPPFSASSFSKWMLTEYNNPKKPLASLQLLVSDQQSFFFTDSNGKTTKVDRATKENVKKGIDKWVELGDSSKDNLVIFYFCGHGIGKGSFLTLLLEDFGQSDFAFLENTIDFYEMHLGMERCKAREQCYFVDACRNPSTTLIEASYRGDPIVHGSFRPSEYGRRHSPIFYSTVPGSPAYGRPESPSVFTEALLRALRGAGTDDIEGDWRVYTAALYEGISRILELYEDPNAGFEQTNLADSLTDFPLHFLKSRPIVPVLIGCKPSSANDKADLAYSDFNNPSWVTRGSKQPTEWHLDLEEGKYRFSASFPNLEYQNKEEARHVRPHSCVCRFEV